jgi:hypothetical protein
MSIPSLIYFASNKLLIVFAGNELSIGLILLPVSVLHGALFTINCRIYGAEPGQDADAAGKVYVWETTGIGLIRDIDGRFYVG